VSFLDCETSPLPPDTQIKADASNTWGYGRLFNNFWFQLEWSMDWYHVDIMANNCLELCALGPSAPPRIQVWKPRLGTVDAINKGSSKEPVVMHFLRCLWFFSAFNEIKIRASGALNTTADMLSRNRAAKFLNDHPWAAPNPTPVPTSLLRIVSPQHLDWTS